MRPCSLVSSGLHEVSLGFLEAWWPQGSWTFRKLDFRRKPATHEGRSCTSLKGASRFEGAEIPGWECGIFLLDRLLEVFRRRQQHHIGVLQSNHRREDSPVRNKESLGTETLVPFYSV